MKAYGGHEGKSTSVLNLVRSEVEEKSSSIAI
jgi:hypothetical protein